MKKKFFNYWVFKMWLNKKNLDKKILAVLIAGFLAYYVDSISTIKQDLYGEIKYRDIPAELLPLQAPTRLKYYLKTSRYHTERLNQLQVWFEVSLKNTIPGNNMVNVIVRTNDISRLAQIELSSEVVKVFMEKKLGKTVHITPMIQSKLFPDFRVENLTVVPTEVSIEGPESLISKIKELETEDYVVKKQDYYSARLKIRQLKGIKIEPKIVNVSFKIVENTISQELYLPVKWINSNEKLAVKRYSPLRVFSKIKGNAEKMKKLDFKDLFYYIDLKEIKISGKFTLPLEIKRIEGIEISATKSRADIEMIKSSE